MSTANFPAAPAPSTAPTLDEVREAYLLNADWEAEQDLEKAKAFMTSCVRLQAMTPRQIQKTGLGLTLTPELLTEQLRNVRSFVRSQTSSAAAKVLKPSLRNFRD